MIKRVESAVSYSLTLIYNTHTKNWRILIIKSIRFMRVFISNLFNWKINVMPLFSINKLGTLLLFQSLEVKYYKLWAPGSIHIIYIYLYIYTFHNNIKTVRKKTTSYCEQFKSSLSNIKIDKVSIILNQYINNRDRFCTPKPDVFVRICIFGLRPTALYLALISKILLVT